MTAETRPRGRSGAQLVHTGVGCLAQLPAALERSGAERVLVVVGPSVSRTEVYASVRRLLTPWEPESYGGAVPHVPLEAVLHGVAVARRVRPDAIVAVGGGSTVDLAKGIVVLGAAGSAPARTGLRPPTLAVVSTTLSQAEFTDVVGITTGRGGTRAKKVLRNASALPHMVFLDGNVAHATPTDLWLSTAFKALDTAIGELARGIGHPSRRTGDRLGRAIEALYAGLRAGGRRTPASDQRLQVAAWQALYPRLNDPEFPRAVAQPWLGAVMRHQVGAVTGAPHGMVACAVLPLAVRLHSDLGLGDVSRAAAPLSVRDVDGMIALVRDLSTSLALPGTLSSLGVEPAQLPLIADAMQGEDARLCDFREDILHRMREAL